MSSTNVGANALSIQPLGHLKAKHELPYPGPPASKQWTILGEIAAQTCHTAMLSPTGEKLLSYCCAALALQHRGAEGIPSLCDCTATTTIGWATAKAHVASEMFENLYRPHRSKGANLCQLSFLVADQRHRRPKPLSRSTRVNIHTSPERRK